MAVLCTRIGLNHLRNILCSRISPIRRLSTNTFLTKKVIPKVPVEFDVKQFTPLYSFTLTTGISYLKRCKKLKLLLFALIFGGIPFYAYAGEITPFKASVILLSGIELFIVYHILATVPKNIIGKIYLSKDKTKLALSYVNDNGRRANTVCKANGLKISDHPNFAMRKFLKKITVMESGLEMDFYYGNGKKIYNELDFGLLFPNIE